jgi:hypothetical protein
LPIKVGLLRRHTLLTGPAAGGQNHSCAGKPNSPFHLVESLHKSPLRIWIAFSAIYELRLYTLRCRIEQFYGAGNGDRFGSFAAGTLSSAPEPLLAHWPLA